MNIPEQHDAAAYDITIRIHLLLRHLTGNQHKWAALERLTGVKAVKWRHVYIGINKPSIAMLDALCRSVPQYAFWLATGMTDALGGHKSPLPDFTFLFQQDEIEIQIDSDSSARYFHTCTNTIRELSNKLIKLYDEEANYKTTQSDLIDELNRQFPLPDIPETPALQKIKEYEIQPELLEKILLLRSEHVESMIRRIRTIPNADELIDSLRAKEQTAK
ncbi:hypothetical protein [Burkholderia sp. IMCC1007]|uniref:hypothetical protein n=1 Tax=Burkholderia sp. IMCC1007 TaxID=3004104 RepID=UPI0022B43702|nr:hypothetical protein [Burkholderia sp. IMCC1007]